MKKSYKQTVIQKLLLLKGLTILFLYAKVLTTSLSDIRQASAEMQTIVVTDRPKTAKILSREAKLRWVLIRLLTACDLTSLFLAVLHGENENAEQTTNFINPTGELI